MKFERSNWYEIGLVPLVNVSAATLGSGKNLPALSAALVISVSVNPPGGSAPVKNTVPLPSQSAVMFVTAKLSGVVA